MNDEQYLEYCRSLLGQFTATLVTRTEQLPQEHPLRELAAGFESLDADPSDVYERGPELVARLFDTYPELTPTFPRELLWFFGADCLHYMADEELAEFQQLEDVRVATPR
jgi:hypothetical protein